MSDKFMPVIGKVPPDSHEGVRDAIHIAVVAMRCINEPYAGSWVRLTHKPNCVFRCDPDDPKRIGVIDPFLPTRWNDKDIPNEGDLVNIFLVPNTISYLRHQWEHPAFDAMANKINTMSESERWLRAFAEKYSFDFDDMIHSAIDETVPSPGVVSRGRDLDRDSVRHDLPEFWRHLEKFTGKGVDQKHRENVYWSCSC